MAKTKQKKCKRGHDLENNRYTVETVHKKTGIESGCRICKNMRNALQREREYFRGQGTPEKIVSVEVFATSYFKEGLR